MAESDGLCGVNLRAVERSSESKKNLLITVPVCLKF